MMKFRTFCKIENPLFFKEREILLPLCDMLEDWWFSDEQVMNVSMPTRLGKTYLGTLFSAWILAHSPHKKIWRCSYSATLAIGNSIQTKNVYLNFLDKAGFPPVKIRGTSDKWTIKGNEPNLIATGYEGSITGFGANVGIFDDMSKNMKNATSASFTDGLDSFYQSVLLGRLEKEPKILNLGTRWTINDWFSKFIPDREFILPALIDGKSCCENWKSTERILLDKEIVNEHIFQAQWMQAPTLKGQYKLFETFEPEVLDVDFSDWKKFIVIDPSQQVGADFFTAGYYAIKKGIVCLLDMYAETSGNLDDVVKWINERNHRLIFCENNGIGKQTISGSLKKGVRRIAPFTTNRDKYSRAGVVYADINNYFAIKKGCSNANLLISQAKEFPAGATDDLIDNVIMAFEYLPIK